MNEQVFAYVMHFMSCVNGILGCFRGLSTELWHPFSARSGTVSPCSLESSRTGSNASPCPSGRARRNGGRNTHEESFGLSKPERFLWLPQDESPQEIWDLMRTNMNRKSLCDDPLDIAGDCTVANGLHADEAKLVIIRGDDDVELSLATAETLDEEPDRLCAQAREVRGPGRCRIIHQTPYRLCARVARPWLKCI